MFILRFLLDSQMELSSLELRGDVLGGNSEILKEGMLWNSVEEEK